MSLARAIVTRPRLLISDEPVSALDASNRNLVLRLLDRLRRELGLAVVVISHDLSSLAGIADRVAVLYRGRLVEQGPIGEVLAHPGTRTRPCSPPRRPAFAANTACSRRSCAPGGPRALAGRRGLRLRARCRFAGPDCAHEPRPRPAEPLSTGPWSTGSVVATPDVAGWMLPGRSSPRPTSRVGRCRVGRCHAGWRRVGRCPAGRRRAGSFVRAAWRGPFARAACRGPFVRAACRGRLVRVRRC
ncbi:hypothetical protein NKH77_54195 [Streptomyces sp. M19]